jgi:tetratricopeptide (TPR) repeat protein
LGSPNIRSPAEGPELTAAADEAMVRGDRHAAAHLLEQAAAARRDAATLLRLATVRRSIGDVPGALAAASAAAELAPTDYQVLMLLGSLRDAVGAVHAAGRAYRAALQYAPASTVNQPRLAQQLDWARRRARAEDQWRARLATARPHGDALAPAQARRMDELRLNILRNLEAGPLRSPEFLVPGLESPEFFDPAGFEGVADLERQTETIVGEFLKLAEAKAPELSSRLGGLEAAQPNAAIEGKWSMIPLIRNGELFEDYAKLCPATMKLFGRLDPPNLSLISPSLYFSVLEPHSRIPPHTGLTNARLIVHWPLIVPGKCGFRVGRQTREWVPGRALVFDDTIEHEAWNDSDRIRVVLIADAWHPGLSAAERLAIAEMLERPLAA